MNFSLGKQVTHLASRHSAARLRGEIEAVLQSEAVVLDLSGIENLSESYADELFGVLVERQGLERLFSVFTVCGASDAVIKAIVRAIRYRLESHGSASVMKLTAQNVIAGIHRRAVHC